MGHKLQANLHRLLLQVRDSVKYDSICFMLQDLHSKQSNTDYNWTGLENYVEELAAEWPEYSGFPSYPIRPAPYITTCEDVREGFWAARRTKPPCGWASTALPARTCSTSSLKGLHHEPGNQASTAPRTYSPAPRRSLGHSTTIQATRLS